MTISTSKRLGGLALAAAMFVASVQRRRRHRRARDAPAPASQAAPESMAATDAAGRAWPRTRCRARAT